MRTLLWLWASVGLACVTPVITAVPLKVMSAPNLLRVGAAENIFVECQDCGSQAPMEVKISAWNHPTKSVELDHTTVRLNADNKYQALGELTIPSYYFDKNTTAKQYVFLQAEFPGRTLEKVVLVSFLSGYMFIQTDKTLYTPNSRVHFRIFALTPAMKPVGNVDATGNPSSVVVEFVTPEGIVIRQGPVSLQSGMYTGSYRLAEFVSIGQWKVVSRFQSNPQQWYSAQFEVKKYVLPSFEVKMTTNTSFYYYDSQSFNVKVQATKEVDGMAYVVFGVMKDNLRKVFPASLQRIPIFDGTGQATLQKEHILKTYPNIEDLVGGSLFVTATVHTESGNEMVKGELRNLQIVTSPYFISFEKTPKYFKPGMPFDVTVAVFYPDGAPAEGVPVLVEPGENIQNTTGANGRVTLKVKTSGSDTSLVITARTNDGNIPADRQASKLMAATPYASRSQNYIHISVISSNVKSGSDLKVHLILSSQSTQFEISYLILSRGQLVGFGRETSEGQVMHVVNIPVTKRMLPSFRLVVYYHPSPAEVVADSVWVEVDDSCMGTLKLQPKDPRVRSYEPKDSFPLRITGEPGATVGLVAVDKGVYVLNKKHLLTQKKVWETVEKADTGCTPGGGRNSMGVFFDAGLIFTADSATGTPHRLEVKCAPPTAEKRRASTLYDAITTLASRYSEPLERDCCKDGMKNTLLSYTCVQRTLYITDGKPCEDAFLYCCEEMAKQRSELKQNHLILACSEDDSSYMDCNEITSRTKFPETWLWETVKIPPCAEGTNCEVNIYDKPISLKDSITTWVFTGISLSEHNGICIGEELDVVVYKQFFIDLRLPYSAVVGEQIEIRAILHNYMSRDEPITVRVDLIEHPNVCSAASKRGVYRQTVTIAPSTTRAVPFVITPMKEGQLKVEVKASVKDTWAGDGVLKHLQVVSKGVLTKVNKVVELNPKGSTQEEIINSGIPKTLMFPDTPSSTKVLVTGREQLIPLVENVIGALSMDSLTYQPTGCGEQNMIHMTLPVIAATYLDKTHQWQSVGLGKRAEALARIKTGLISQMNYAKPDGSFAVWPHEKGSTWLTAYVIKGFSMATNLIDVDSDTICNAVKFLILSSQLPDGTFKETGPVYHREMTGDVQDGDSDASMTAYCLIAMQESQQICNSPVKALRNAIDKSVAFLERRLPSLTNPYAVAITSYALANANQLNKEILYNFVAPGRTHWQSPKGEVFSVEATAYALLALVKGEFLEDAQPVVRWFTQQQKVGGGYGSTQATVMAYLALSEYWAVAREPDYNLDVELIVPGKNAPYNFRFTRDNDYTSKISKNFSPDENVTVTAKGTGEAALTLMTQFYAVPKKTVSDCARFNLSVEFSLDKVDETDGDIYKLRMEFLFKSETEDASMSVLDVGLPTGFIHLDEDLNALSEGHAAVISEWEYNKELSEKSSIIIYLKKVAHNHIEEVTFRMRQTHKVGVLQPAAVSIYEYYDETKCVRYYHPESTDGRILIRCRGAECLCAEENCFMQKKGSIDNMQRIAKLCETEQTNIDFVYQAVLEDVSYDVSLDVYAMRIENVIKTGTYDNNAQGQLRKFISFPHCRESLNLQKTKGYLIMGTAEDTSRDETAQSYEYLLGERTWIEFWPRGEECELDQHRAACLGIQVLEEEFRTHGCRYK